MNDWSAVLGLPLWFWLFVLPFLGAVLCFFAKETAHKLLRPIWHILDRLYTLGGLIAACFMVTILLLIVAQMVSRWSNVAFAGSTEFAGYAMAATSFFALAHALTHGAHIRVSILLNFKNTFSFWLDAFALLNMFNTAPWGWPDLWANTGSDWIFTPVWVPQIPMSIGTILLAIALWDCLYRLLVTGTNPIKSEAVE